MDLHSLLEASNLLTYKDALLEQGECLLLDLDLMGGRVL